MVLITPERIRELSAQARANVEIKANDEGDTRWWVPDHFDQEFAKLVVKEVAKASVTKATSPKSGVADKLQLVEKWFSGKEDKDKVLGLLADYDVMMGIGESE